MKFTKIPSDTFSKLQLNAGILTSDFDPSTGEMSDEDLLGATSGGINFTAAPSYSDFGEDIDNCPNNMLELKKLDSIEVTMSGTFISVDTNTAKMLVGSADIDKNDASHVVPRRDLKKTDFNDIWWIGDYSDENGETNGGFIAIKLLNALSTGGFQIQSTKNGKGQFAFTFTGHYSMEEPDKVPYEIYIKSGESEGESETESTESVSLMKEGAEE
ncbi:MAG: hypothetical protein NC320_09085 [Clostridium sp.]|nr:hypothetical protein [Clostridium sp.]MCM1547919.1 hypothetical protein [Ruminococcus sp.]